MVKSYALVGSGLKKLFVYPSTGRVDVVTLRRAAP